MTTVPDEVDAATLETWLAAPAADAPLVIDVRTSPEYELGHVPGARNVPLASLPSAIPDLEIGDRVVFVCEVGTASRQAGRLLESSERVGADTAVYNLAGGMRDWDGPVRRETPADPDDR